MKTWSFKMLAGMLALGGMMVFGAQSGRGEEVTLRFWHTMNEAETPTLQSIVQEFEAANPDIKVQLEYVPFGESRNKFQIAAEAGNAADVARLDLIQIAYFADLEYLLPLDDYLTAEDKADYLPGAFAYNVYQGVTYGIPQVTDALALLYNKRLLKEAGHDAPPTTLAELEQTVADVKAKLGIEGFYLRSSTHWFLCFLWAFGGGLVDENGKILINTEPSVNALEYIVNQKDKLFPGTIDFQNEYNEMMGLFKDGKVAMIINGPWATADILTGKEFQDAANLGVAVFPKGPNGDQGSPVGGHSYAIYSDTPYPEESAQFIQFINQAQYQARFTVKNNLLPSRRSAYDFPEVKNNALAQSFLPQMEVAKNRPVMRDSWQLYMPLSPALREAWRGEKTPQQVMDEVAAAWQEFFKQE